MADISRINLPAATTDIAAVAATPNLRLLGFSITETAGAVASLSIQESAANDTTKELFGITLLANESRSEWFGDHGIPCPAGIWVERITGTTRITIFYRVSDYGKDSGQAPSW